MVLTLMLLLSEEGHEVHAAHDAQQALDSVLRFNPDAVILDIALGRDSGYEVAKTIRARHGDARPLIIGISGRYKMGADRVLAELSGFNHYLLKPCDPAEVLRLLEPMRHAAPRAEQSEVEFQAHTYRAALSHAATLLGDARRLSERLHVGMAELARWLAGEEEPPIDLFFRVVDIILDEHKKLRANAPSAQISDFPKPAEPQS